MGRPRGSGKNTAMVNGRITADQMEWLVKHAEELGGNLSAALRRTIEFAQWFEAARQDYADLREENPEFSIPPHADGTSRLLSVALSPSIRWTDDLGEAEDKL